MYAWLKLPKPNFPKDVVIWGAYLVKTTRSRFAFLRFALLRTARSIKESLRLLFCMTSLPRCQELGSRFWQQAGGAITQGPPQSLHQRPLS